MDAGRARRVPTAAVAMLLSARTGDGIELLQQRTAAALPAGRPGEDVFMRPRAPSRWRWARPRHHLRGCRGRTALPAAGTGSPRNCAWRQEALERHHRRVHQPTTCSGDIFGRFCIGK
ncbi:MAG: hypothetical protein MZW92_76660 [Comamonadaceae bacterium]|nr:hypothetical protein [Comamonadaceae bacterium]